MATYSDVINGLQLFAAIDGQDKHGLNIPCTHQWFDGDLDQWGNRFPKTQEEL